MRAGLIVGAAPAHDVDGVYRDILSIAPLVFAADAAGEWCVELGRTPDVVVGDFDSAAPGAAARLRARGARVVELPAHKDVSDLEACVAEARSEGVCTAFFTAAFCGRVDHTLAALGTVLRAADLRARVREPGWDGWALDGESMPAAEVYLPVGATFSVVAPGGADGVTITGGSYPLTGARLDAMSSFGVGNTVAESPIVVSVRSGSMLIIAARNP